MNVLIADDDAVSRCILEMTLQDWGLKTFLASDGVEGWKLLQEKPEVKLAILDWMMPVVDGVELCRRIRSNSSLRSLYVIMLTAKSESNDVVSGLDAGADDYVTKPFNVQELHARVRVGLRMIELQNELSRRIHELEDALSKVKQLQGLLPICSYCKRIRDDQNYWQQVDGYLARHSTVEVSHSICPSCLEVELAKLRELK